MEMKRFLAVPAALLMLAACTNSSKPAARVTTTTPSTATATTAASTTSTGQSSIDAVAVLAGNGNTWVAVDRPTICNNHDVTPSFYNTACGTS